MANIGLRYAKYNEIDYTTGKYKEIKDDKVPVAGKLIDAKLNEERNEASLFADDTQAEYANEFKNATLSLTLDDVTDETYAHLKGCKIEEGELTENIENTAPELGYGHIVTKMISGEKKYKVEFLPRLVITKITADAKTKGDSLEFNTASIEAKVMALEKEINGLKIGDWKKVKTFTTLEEAITYLDGLLTPVA